MSATPDPARRVLDLPYPPSVNHYWRRAGARTLISREGRAYRARVCAALAGARGAPLEGRLSVRVAVHPPDRRRRDIDNIGKALLDALAHAGVYRDDSQIDSLLIERAGVAPGGLVRVEVEEVRA